MPRGYVAGAGADSPRSEDVRTRGALPFPVAVDGAEASGAGNANVGDDNVRTQRLDYANRHQAEVVRSAVPAMLIILASTSSSRR
jgi:hypothetical protein